MSRERWAPWVAFIAAIVAIVASSNIPSHGGGVWWMVYAASKPTATLALFAWAWWRYGDDATRKGLILIGLLLSLLGDIALLWPQDGFILGLGAFLLAHLAYIAAFSVRSGFARHLGPFVIVAVFCAGVLYLLWPRLSDGLRWPVLAYVVCLGCMAAQSWSWWLSLRASGMSRELERHALRAALGGSFFLVSDASLAINRFMQPLPYSSLLILSTYWIAQAFIVSSVMRQRSS
jgi:uncharacterized membrane protein YhhN